LNALKFEVWVALIK